MPVSSCDAATKHHDQLEEVNTWLTRTPGLTWLRVNKDGLSGAEFDTSYGTLAVVTYADPGEASRLTHSISLAHQLKVFPVDQSARGGQCGPCSNHQNREVTSTA